ncbi:bifunctional hydroxymethylpyrimidine kinase/phosphomethylpyrimidine kinase [Thermodesulforhabdus norvegica]|uniref:hydroxymethylpyrimidine kinase n=1 Tax=Thermodesulforhabdus norvegica TaxID=39841 RepID=A0A1I4TPQ5_9BACT|nr:bifunctional hydroxymethylpyrimidine kinase/phosphomethylpyrimidine kinase [Thermodesulforhabdus norvegica]SFM78689.1 hydroxymethylpyrimidine/phosphomethylpyrimidine kinase [Thermodesulforhabdus norvegica]
MKVAKAMTIAGSDSGGGAGIQADLKTFSALGVYGTTVITALTAQNTCAVTGIYGVDADFVAAQIDAVMEDIGTDAAKTGMLSDAGIIRAVARKVREWKIEKMVVDPVMISKSGAALLKSDAVRVLKDELLPLAHVVTPNIAEAESLTGITIRSVDDMKQAAVAIRDYGPKYVVVKGGHLSGKVCVDILFDGEDWRFFESPRVETRHTHGTGCTFSAAITAFLAMGQEVGEAVSRAKEYITRALQHAFPVGRGHSPVHHFYAWNSS